MIVKTLFLDNTTLALFECFKAFSPNLRLNHKGLKHLVTYRLNLFSPIDVVFDWDTFLQN